MRAICESCAGPQPVDWRPGDLCGHCGNAVREEQRCYWCVQWTPNRKFCRKCGAVSIFREHYGAARMLKHMGASVYEIPKLLGELDGELITTHRSLYAVHLAAANRHIDYARELSQRLYQKHWASELEEALLPQLPWAEKDLRIYATAPLGVESPVPMLRDLTLLAQFQNGNFDQLRDGAHLIHSADSGIAAEAALQLSGWRALYGTYTEINRHDLIAVLRNSPLPRHAAPRMVALGADPRPDFSETGDPDTDFLIVLLAENIPALEAALHSDDSMRRFVAASQLVRWNHPTRIGTTLRAATGAQQLLLLQDIVRYKRPVPALHEEIFAIFTAATNPKLKRTAAQAISLAAIPADAIRLLELRNGNQEIIHTLLLAPLSPETFFEIGRRLVADGTFSLTQWGWDRAAKPGAMPVTFVEEMYPIALDGVQRELLRFAELQIEAHGVPQTGLERFLIRQCFAQSPPETIGTAWACIHRIQMHRTVGLTVPCDLSLPNIAWCWNMREILTGIASLMASPDAVLQTFVRDDFDRFLRSAAPDFFREASGFPDECQKIIAAAPLADPYTYSARFAMELSRWLRS